MIGQGCGIEVSTPNGLPTSSQSWARDSFWHLSPSADDMAGIENIELLVLAPNQAHDGLGLRQSTDMILFSGDIEDRTANIREVYSSPPQHNLTLYQLILLIKLANPLPEC